MEKGSSFEYMKSLIATSSSLLHVIVAFRNVLPDTDAVVLDIPFVDV